MTMLAVWPGWGIKTKAASTQPVCESQSMREVMMLPEDTNMASSSRWVIDLGRPLTYRLAPLISSQLGRASDTYVDHTQTTFHSFIDSFIHWFIHSLIHSFTDSFIHWFIHSLIHSFTDSFIHSFIHSLIHSFTDSFIHSFIAICRLHYVENVESEALEAVARWSGIGKIVSF